MGIDFKHSNSWDVPPGEPKPRKGWRRLCTRGFLIKAGIAFVVLAVIGAVVLSEMLFPYRKKAREYDLAEVRKVETASVVYDRNGDVLGSLFTENRRPVPINAISPIMIEAVLATEDARFYEHGGVDLVGVIRASITNLMERRIAQGASTITQQLARQTFDMTEVSYERKLTEMFLARRIEQVYSKNEILQHYLNLIYFGSGFYGIESAALGYFGKHASELSLSECASLSALIKRPNAYNPFKSIELATEARNRSLLRMRDLDMISKEVYEETIADPVVALDPSLRSGKGLHVMGEIRRRLDRIFEDSIGPRDGISVHTSIDANLELALRRSVSERLNAVEKTDAVAGGPDPASHPLEAAAVVIRNDTGELLASVGGRDFRRSEFDRAFRAKRMMGTAFTPFIYAAALESGIDPYEEVLDAPLDNREVMIGALEGIVGEWGAEDPENKYEGRISAWKAIVSSKNAATVRLGKQLENEGEVLQLVRRAGITSNLRIAPSSILGQTEVSPAELTLAYSSFPNGGKRPELIKIILKVVDEDKNVIYENTEPGSLVPVMQPLTAGYVHSALAGALERGTGATSVSELGLNHMPAGGKTGTAYNFTDAWFLGYTSEVTCGVWVGHDQPQTIGQGAFGSVMALPVWVDAMNAAIEKNLPDQIAAPPGTERAFVCDYTGEAATDYCTERKLVPAVSAEPLFVACTHRASLPADRAKYLQPCSRHAENTLPDGFKLLKTDAGSRPVASAALMVPPVYPQSPTLVGDDPFGTVAAVNVQSTVPVAPAIPVAPPAPVAPQPRVLPAGRIDPVPVPAPNRDQGLPVRGIPAPGKHYPPPPPAPAPRRPPPGSPPVVVPGVVIPQ